MFSMDELVGVALMAFGAGSFLVYLALSTAPKKGTAEAEAEELKAISG